MDTIFQQYHHPFLIDWFKHCHSYIFTFTPTSIIMMWIIDYSINFAYKNTETIILFSSLPSFPVFDKMTKKNPRTCISKYSIIFIRKSNDLKLGTKPFQIFRHRPERERQDIRQRNSSPASRHSSSPGPVAHFRKITLPQHLDPPPSERTARSRHRSFPIT